MMKKLAWICVAMLLVAGAVAQAGALQAGIGTPPKSMDRHLAPDQYPTNVVKILRTTNKAETNSYVPVVFAMNNVNPFAVIRFLRRPIEPEEGLLFTFVNPDGKSGLVLYNVPKYMIDSLQTLVHELDRPGLTTSASDQIVMRQMLHRNVMDSSFVATAASLLSGDGTTLVLDPATNALVWKDVPSGGDNLGAALTDSLDKPTASIQLLVKAYDLNVTNDGTLGLDFASWINGPGRNLFALGGFYEHGDFGHNKAPVVQPVGSGAVGLPRNNFAASGWNYAVQYNVPSAFFDFLAVKGKAKVLDQAKIAAMNNKSASLSAGDQILYYKTVTSDSSIANGTRPTGAPFAANDERQLVPAVVSNTGTNQSHFVQPYVTATEATLSVDVTPLISENNVTLDLDLGWADFNGLDDTGVPQINRRELKTTLRTQLGDEIVIGGLNRQVKLNHHNGVPILSSIPVLGYLFGNEIAQTQKSELVVSIQPLGIMTYDIASDYKVSAPDQAVIDQASGKMDNEKTEPALNWGFDMYGLDKEKQVIEPMGGK